MEPEGSPALREGSPALRDAVPGAHRYGASKLELHNRLRRIEAQVRRVDRMLLEDRIASMF